MRILLVDDDVSLRNVIKMGLELRGHTVRTAADGDFALDRYREGVFEPVLTVDGEQAFEYQKFDFVLTDFQFIPGKRVKNGADLVREVRAINPDQRMAIMTGAAREARKALDPAIQDVAVLEKPFGFSALKELLD